MSHSLVGQVVFENARRDGGEAAVIILRSQTTNYLNVPSLLKIERRAERKPGVRAIT
jgi:hypothetical protein